MEKIYWAIQSLDNVGGTEAVSVNLMNLLCAKYDITLVSVFSYSTPYPHKLDPRIKVITLGLPQEVSRFDQNAGRYGLRHPIKLIKLVAKSIGVFLFSAGKIRKKLLGIIEEDALFIASSIDSYRYAPKGRTVLFHYHFDADKFFSFIESWGRRHSRKPDGYVFLAESIKNEVAARKKKLAPISFAITNPIKFPRVKALTYNGNALLFVGRYTAQKDPMFALQIAKALHEDGFPFTLDMYGGGHLEKEMREYIENNGLTEVKLFVNVPTTPEIYQAHDLFLFTSAYEGFGLVKGEANMNSLPVLSTKWKGPIEEVFVDPREGIVLDSHDPKDFAAKIKEMLVSKEKALQSKADVYEASARLESGPIVEKWENLFSHFFNKEE